MRNALLALLLLNLVYFGWARWIDVPPPPPANPSYDRLPRLTLVRELPATKPVAATSGSSDGAPAPAAATTAPAASSRCVSVGPFNDLQKAARAAAMLHDRGFTSRQRAEQGDTWRGFWVYIDGFKTAADEARTLKALEQAGVADAHALPESEQGRRISVGLFTDRIRAERRARLVEHLGITANVAEHQVIGSVYWVDLDLGANDSAVPTDGLATLDEPGSHIEVRVCPTAATPPTDAPTPSTGPVPFAVPSPITAPPKTPAA